MKTILLLTDFSAKAGYAAEFAMNIAVKCKANLVLCHVMELTTYIGENDEFSWPVADNLVLESESILNLRELASRLETLVPSDFKPSINFITEFGLLADVVEKIIDNRSIDLVVTGSHKSNGVSTFLFGSHTHAVLDKINCPVLIVPESVHFNGIDHIAYATDLTFDNQKVIKYLIDVAKPFNAIIAVNHISQTDYPVTSLEQALGYSMNEQLGPDHPPVFFHTIKGENVRASLLEMTGSGRADIFALVHKRYGFFKRLFHASISKQMANNGKVPILVLPYSFSMEMAAFANDDLDSSYYETSNSH